jgi:hypothetical protein
VLPAHSTTGTRRVLEPCFSFVLVDENPNHPACVS